MSKDGTVKIDADALERLALTFVDGHGEGRADGELATAISERYSFVDGVVNEFEAIQQYELAFHYSTDDEQLEQVLVEAVMMPRVPFTMPL